MHYRLFMSVITVLSFLGCAAPPQKPAYVYNPPSRQIDYVDDVRPVLVNRCVVCHSCYNSPCQLKLSSWEGLDRGASKEQIYNASRLKTMDPSRLFIDAQTTSEWREKNFFPVKQEKGVSEYDESIMFLLLDHKRQSPSLLDGEDDGKYFSEASDLTCSENAAELKTFLKKHPNRGMPFGFPPLSQEEFDTVVGWLSQGAYGPTPEQQAALEVITDRDRSMLDMWEAFLNRQDPKYQMTARYLYEHLFLAHISFKTGSNDFFELVRSRSGPGQEIDIIATVRPYDDPGEVPFYYRFRKIHATIVFKTHMVFAMDDRQFQRVNALFIQSPWPQKPTISSYDRVTSSSPFETFAQIPVRSRYQWLLDNARYTVMTFIRGPVCKGQIALNVINDQFWVLFLDPDYDLSVQYPGFLKLHYQHLRLPDEKGSGYKLWKALLKDKHKRWALEYYKARQDFYAAHYPYGLGTEAIWPGTRADDQPMLTVFRHFDSASVHRGALGNLPKTAWVIDYPLLERIYYSLVAGFDIYGTAGHQLATRRYMDALRIEGESYFLDFMPMEAREPMMASWYIGVPTDEMQYYPSPLPAGEQFKTMEPKREFMEKVVQERLAVEGIAFDQNYLPAGATYPTLPEKYETEKDYIQGFISVSAPGVSFFRHVKDHNANVAWIKIKNIPDKPDMVVSAVINRWHDNVKYLIGEETRLNPAKDHAVFIKGFIGSYPNYFFVVDAADLPEFFEILDNYDGSDTYKYRLEKFGVNRAESNFWKVFDWFQDRFLDSDIQEAGIVDLNRYYYLATKHVIVQETSPE
ncbi:MAG: fatty acid cis/trans isomerase [Pseudomonadota bacterium]